MHACIQTQRDAQKPKTYALHFSTHTHVYVYTNIHTDAREWKVRISRKSSQDSPSWRVSRLHICICVCVCVCVCCMYVSSKNHQKKVGQNVSRDSPSLRVSRSVRERMCVFVCYYMFFCVCNDNACVCVFLCVCVVVCIHIEGIPVCVCVCMCVCVCETPFLCKYWKTYFPSHITGVPTP
jgi:hypothetical protein